jgi:hypothetical protein
MLTANPEVTNAAALSALQVASQYRPAATGEQGPAHAWRGRARAAAGDGRAARSSPSRSELRHPADGSVPGETSLRVAATTAARTAAACSGLNAARPDCHVNHTRSRSNLGTRYQSARHIRRDRSTLAVHRGTAQLAVLPGSNVLAVPGPRPAPAVTPAPRAMRSARPFISFAQ